MGTHKVWKNTAIFIVCGSFRPLLLFSVDWCWLAFWPATGLSLNRFRPLLKPTHILLPGPCCSTAVPTAMGPTGQSRACGSTHGQVC